MKFDVDTLPYRQQPDDKAKKLGLVVVRPAPDELFIDIDSDDDLKIYEQNIEVVRETWQAVETRRTESPSKLPGHYHIVVKLGTTVSPEQRIMFQAFLGSDRLRETLNWYDLQCRRIPEDVSVFFERLA